MNNKKPRIRGVFILTKVKIISPPEKFKELHLLIGH